MSTGSYSQTGRIISLSTAPIGTDTFLLSGFSGEEGISTLFRFKIGLLTPNDKYPDVLFGSVLGQSFTIKCAVHPGDSTDSSGDDSFRYFNGICVRFSQGDQDGDFTSYEAEIVPKLWKLTRIVRSRIFQNMSVKDILQKVLEGYTTNISLSGTYEPRNYCVQYRESDFDFISRLMEEEGIFYFFTHTDSDHKMVVTDSGMNYPDASPKTALFDLTEGSEQSGIHITDWRKTQEVRSGKTTLWDHHFQLPGKNLEAQKTTASSVSVGEHPFYPTDGGSSDLELYDYPGGYAKRFDGVDGQGGDSASNLQKVFTDNTRTAGLRMEEETAHFIRISGGSNCVQFGAGLTMTLSGHFDSDGDYVFTHVMHSAESATSYRTAETSGFEYRNSFEVIPNALVYRTARATPRPVIPGVQTAEVVGPSGQEIFTDKYGRVKVMFNWDRDDGFVASSPRSGDDANRSCWLRVATPWAGKNWGMIHIPRIGQEVVVQFEDGDPDCPIIIGSVYNADQMPPYTLPDKMTQSGIVSRSTQNGGTDDSNVIRFEDKQGAEQIFINAQYDMDVRVEHDSREIVMGDEHVIIQGLRKEQVQKDENIDVQGNRNVKVEKNDSLNVTTDLNVKVGGDASLNVTGNQNESVTGNVSLQVTGGRGVKITGADSLQASGAISISGQSVVIEGMTSLCIMVGGNFITIGESGIAIQGTEVMINSGGAAGSVSPPQTTSPKDPTDAAMPPDTADDGTKATKLQ